MSCRLTDLSTPTRPACCGGFVSGATRPMFRKRTLADKLHVVFGRVRPGSVRYFFGRGPFQPFWSGAKLGCRPPEKLPPDHPILKGQKNDTTKTR